MERTGDLGSDAASDAVEPVDELADAQAVERERRIARLVRVLPQDVPGPHDGSQAEARESDAEPLREVKDGFGVVLGVRAFLEREAFGRLDEREERGSRGEEVVVVEKVAELVLDPVLHVLEHGEPDGRDALPVELLAVGRGDHRPRRERALGREVDVLLGRVWRSEVPLPEHVEHRERARERAERRKERRAVLVHVERERTLAREGRLAVGVRRRRAQVSDPEHEQVHKRLDRSCLDDDVDRLRFTCDLQLDWGRLGARGRCDGVLRRAAAQRGERSPGGRGAGAYAPRRRSR